MDPVPENKKKTAGRWPKGTSGNPAKQFRKGQSGNPGGRPKKPAMTRIYEEVFEDPKMRAAIKSQTFKTMSSKGMAGVLERREAAQRLEGKVKDSVDLNLSGRLTLEQVLEARKKAHK